jgi:hypothetical protein
MELRNAYKHNLTTLEAENTIFPNLQLGEFGFVLSTDFSLAGSCLSLSGSTAIFWEGGNNFCPCLILVVSVAVCPFF